MPGNWILKNIKLDYLGQHQVQVIDPAGPTLLWQCELPDTGDGELALLAPLDGQRFVALHSSGRVFTGQVAQRQLAELANLGVSGDLGAWLDQAKGLLWVAARHRLQGARHKQLLALNLDSGELAMAFDLPAFDLDLNTLQPLSAGRFGFYGRNDKGGYKFRQHWLGTLDSRSGQWQQQLLDSKPTPEEVSIRRQRFIDQGRALMVLPGADGIQAQGEGFEYPLSLLNLDQPEGSWTRPVRLLSAAAMDNDMGDIEALARIAGGQISSSDNGDWMTFLVCLTAVGFCPDQDAAWLGWQDGALQKVSLAGERLSPLFYLQEDGDRRQPERMCTKAISHIQVLAGEGLVLGVGEHDDFSYWQAQPQDSAAPATLAEAEQNRQPLACSAYQPPALAVPPALAALPSASGCVTISTSDLESDAGCLGALRQLKELMGPLQQQLQQAPAKAGMLGKLLGKKAPATAVRPLYLAFCDSLGRCQSDYQFLATALHTEGGPALMAEILAAFSRWPFASQLCGGKGEPPFAELAFYLSEHHVQHLPVLAAYFNGIGGGEGVHPYHINRTLAVLNDAYAGTPELAAFLAAVPWPYNDPSFTLAERDEYDEWDDDEDDDDWDDAR
ncbi:hypothetical protein B3C1_17552 [Gallaecimonas xiamenensis 3-C-1]|uniref:Uncharacterized protein n=2 Tax=Gallaecimonas TaxID=745410 RepID=K2IDI7_9GAMM|nr:hypothetical protein B3C1_17552 [Gallaecimonas xiamenensis 3-C-1]